MKKLLKKENQNWWSESYQSTRMERNAEVQKFTITKILWRKCWWCDPKILLRTSEDLFERLKYDSKSLQLNKKYLLGNLRAKSYISRSKNPRRGCLDKIFVGEILIQCIYVYQIITLYTFSVSQFHLSLSFTIKKVSLDRD